MSSSPIHLTPEEIENFSRVLEQYANELTDATQNLNHNLQQLGDTWRDTAFAEFEDKFVEARQYIENFVKVADEQVAFLKRKAEAAYIARDQR